MPEYFYRTDVTKYREKLAELKGDVLDAFVQFNSKAFGAGALSTGEGTNRRGRSAHHTLPLLHHEPYQEGEGGWCH